MPFSSELEQILVQDLGQALGGEVCSILSALSPTLLSDGDATRLDADAVGAILASMSSRLGIPRRVPDVFVDPKGIGAVEALMRGKKDVSQAMFLQRLRAAPLWRLLIRQTRLEAARSIRPQERSQILSYWNSCKSEFKDLTLTSLAEHFAKTANRIGRRTWDQSLFEAIAKDYLTGPEVSDADPTDSICSAPALVCAGVPPVQPHAGPSQSALRKSLATSKTIKSAEDYYAVFLDGPWRIMEPRRGWWVYEGESADVKGGAHVRKVALKTVGEGESPSSVVILVNYRNRAIFGVSPRHRSIAIGSGLHYWIRCPEGIAAIARFVHWSHSDILTYSRTVKILEAVVSKLPPLTTFTEADALDENLDANKLDLVQAHLYKMAMDKNFKQLKPGDAGYQHDKRLDIPTQQKSSTWDESASDSD